MAPEPQSFNQYCFVFSITMGSNDNISDDFTNELNQNKSSNWLNDSSEESSNPDHWAHESFITTKPGTFLFTPGSIYK